MDMRSLCAGDPRRNLLDPLDPVLRKVPNKALSLPLSLPLSPFSLTLSLSLSLCLSLSGMPNGPRGKMFQGSGIDCWGGGIPAAVAESA
jgi:hypothetical protein